MNTYVRDRLLADARHAVQGAKDAGSVQHAGLRGGFRELLVDGLLTPWLPPYAVCGTGMIVDAKDRHRDATQEDIVIFDRSVVPPILASRNGLEGVFPIEGVLVRVEVKSTLNIGEVRKTARAASDFRNLKFSTELPQNLGEPISLLFAFGSDLTEGDDKELTRLFDVTEELGLVRAGNCPTLDTPLNGLCVVGRGFWFWGGLRTSGGHDARWLRARRTADGLEEVLTFVGLTSGTCFFNHIWRQGRIPNASLEGGIAQYFLEEDPFVDVSRDLVPRPSSPTDSTSGG
jgi:hypothetical protein